jgi:hypothetical protein
MILEDDTSRIVAVGERGRGRLSSRQSCVGLARYRAEQQFQGWRGGADNAPVPSVPRHCGLDEVVPASSVACRRTVPALQRSFGVVASACALTAVNFTRAQLRYA